MSSGESPYIFDPMIHSTPARTTGHWFEISLYNEFHALMAEFRFDMNWRMGYDRL